MVTPLHNERRCCVHRLQKFWRLFNCKISRKPVYIQHSVNNLKTKNLSQMVVIFFVIYQCSTYVPMTTFMCQKAMKANKIKMREGSHYLCLPSIFSIKHYSRTTKLKLPLMATLFWAMQPCRLVQIYQCFMGVYCIYFFILNREAVHCSTMLVNF
jgi:hypothetical protein